ncbi:hypothetical protein CFOL_v3_28761 [Cephalotus follicularis]|uniref:UBN2_3 domain-containing protein n=1 Tax=Cephalotus follicularis TaxID=3775 RepID=A0A1Q3CZ38_CEPFO|nr:hypothetical protein CFOL_v3_28761 [Cephalotus follicularis]
MESESIKVMNQDMVKLDRFDGNNFARWQDKMIFLLTALKIYYILDLNLLPIEEPVPTDDGTQPSAEAIDKVIKERKKREEDELSRPEPWDGPHDSTRDNLYNHHHY